MKRYDMCYRLGKELDVATDEEGNPAEAYASLSFETEKQLTEEELKQLHEVKFKRHICMGQEDWLPYITPISKEEYDANTTEEDTHERD